jgi:NUMOD4 motif-containing protein/HNH endonuclease
MKEVWKDIRGYEGLYQISSLGRIKSLPKHYWCGLNHASKKEMKEMYMKFNPNQDGYYLVGLSKNGEQKRFSVHRLVAKAFIPNPKNKPQVNHIDCNIINNSVSNLEWSTNLENQLHAVVNNRYRTKISNTDIIKITEYAKVGGYTHDEIAYMFSVNQSTITRIINNDRRKHRSLTFKL